MSDPGTPSGPVLVPVDFSPPSEEAFLFAADYARLAGAPLIVLHVLHDAQTSPGVYRMKDENGDLMPMMDAAEVLMTRFGERMRDAAPELVAAVEPEWKLTKGLPATRILEFATQVDARLLVLGNSGQGSFSRLVMGSTADQVVKDAPMPVTLTKAPTD